MSLMRENYKLYKLVKTFGKKKEEETQEKDIKITDASYLFYGGARADLLEKLCSCITEENTTCNSMFSYSQYKIKTIPLFITKNVTDFSYMFSRCYGISEIPKLDTSNGTHARGMFYSDRTARSLTKIAALDFGKMNDIYDLISLHVELTDLGGFLNLGKAYTQATNNYSSYLLDLSESTKLTHESLINVINGLYDLNLVYNVANGGTLYTQTLRLGSTNLAKLTAEEIAVATAKGWTLS